MRIKCIILALLIFVNTLSASAQEGAIKEYKQLAPVEFYSGDFTYIIGPGDVLEINVWRHPDLRTQA